ncbi:MAG: hypothetical protein HXX16_09200 [Bacteroidales bacterium]|nr:hypothetical protein [Bacteroidales bacterium]
MKINTKGYYISEPVHWVDWQASLKLEGDSFYIIKFDTLKCFFESVNDLNNINLNNISQKENYGLYEVNDNTIEIKYNPNTEFEVKRMFTILSSEILLDEELKEYRYVESCSPEVVSKVKE